VFQLESRGMRILKKLKPDCSRTSSPPSRCTGRAARGRHGRRLHRPQARAQKVEYPHPWLERCSPTYGVIVYQEQVMQIAQVLAGYSLGGADLLRRAMGKKKPEEMAKQRSECSSTARASGRRARDADHIFDLMETFAGYGFNKSHSAAYALVAYQTAWLKRHFPSAYMAAVLTADLDNTDRLVVLKDDCTRFGITLEPPDVNRSEFRIHGRRPKRISYGLGALKGMAKAPSRRS
jgi:DNA polymerase-3 subunit alpha